VECWREQAGGDGERELIMCVAADLVTETDKAVEKFVLGELKTKYPDFEYVRSFIT
jgi:fructose-1,6-bisphosphatase/inositol monophosphatase family enzyme